MASSGLGLLVLRHLAAQSGVCGSGALAVPGNGWKWDFSVLAQTWICTLQDPPVICIHTEFLRRPIQLSHHQPHPIHRAGVHREWKQDFISYRAHQLIHVLWSFNGTSLESKLSNRIVQGRNTLKWLRPKEQNLLHQYQDIQTKKVSGFPFEGPNYFTMTTNC